MTCSRGIPLTRRACPPPVLPGRVGAGGRSRRSGKARCTAVATSAIATFLMTSPIQKILSMSKAWAHVRSARSTRPAMPRVWMNSAELTRPARRSRARWQRAAGEPLDDEAAEPGRQREADQVARRGAGQHREAGRAPGEDRQPGGARDDVEQDGEEAAAHAEHGPREEDREGLQGDRHRGADRDGREEGADRDEGGEGGDQGDVGAGGGESAWGFLRIPERWSVERRSG